MLRNNEINENTANQAKMLDLQKYFSNCLDLPKLKQKTSKSACFS
jgi:hypothetical protein